MKGAIHTPAQALQKRRSAPDRENRKWENSLLNPGATGPEYPLPWDGNDIEEWTVSGYQDTQLTSAYLPLPFYSYPMWPVEWNAKRQGHAVQTHYNDAEHPERFANLFCVQCNERVYMGQLVIHFVSGLRRKNNQPGITSDARLLCPDCMPPWSGKALVAALENNMRTTIGHLSYFPFMLLAQTTVDKLLDPWKRSIMEKELEFLKLQHQCIICRRTGIHNRLRTTRGRTVTICMPRTDEVEDSYCLSVFYDMLTHDSPHCMAYPCVPSYERLVTLLFHLRFEYPNRPKTNDHHLPNNIVSFLRWEYCTTCFRNMRDAKEAFECGVCYRVQYCSAKCANKDHELHKTICQPWRDVFQPDHLVILHERSISLKEALDILQRVEDALALRYIYQGPPLNQDREKLDMRHLDFRNLLAQFQRLK